MKIAHGLAGFALASMTAFVAAQGQAAPSETSPSPSHRADGAIQNCPKPKIQASAVTLTPRIDRSLSRSGLARLEASGGGSEEEIDSVYEAQTNLGINFETEPLAGSSFEHCVVSVSLRVELEAVMRIASEIQPGGCMDQEILARGQERREDSPAEALGGMTRHAKEDPPTPMLVIAKDEEQAKGEAAKMVVSYAQRLYAAMGEAMEEGDRQAAERQAHRAVSCKAPESSDFKRPVITAQLGAR